MITFGKFMEIAVDPYAMDLIQKQVDSLRSSSKVKPDESGFNIIRIRLSYATYNVFKRYITPRYELAGALLNRRGDNVDFVFVNASNEELANLKELAERIIKDPDGGQFNSKESERRTAKATLEDIDKSIMASSRT
jgi:hypothetical protein